ncbi:hypothetical protein PLICRDRAFT_371266 [Plicaturopsis crispa FD-325 SS-3]|uniref:Unplaced genomic scaffold PLICRscaffold_19, whole genome shotgun sequence n=1 Tax=Plicaturopsis crispa FD-325 SS-3 TaxID=944288 RepID=A0A0C9SKQ3_PLICR|nr:hypothetical protein PLICRDRAFT_371266 [Plicaturopsis crispa FD-325 SS-3]
MNGNSLTPQNGVCQVGRPQERKMWSARLCIVTVWYALPQKSIGLCSAKHVLHRFLSRLPDDWHAMPMPTRSRPIPIFLPSLSTPGQFFSFHRGLHPPNPLHCLVRCHEVHICYFGIAALDVVSRVPRARMSISFRTGYTALCCLARFPPQSTFRYAPNYPAMHAVTRKPKSETAESNSKSRVLIRAA